MKRIMKKSKKKQQRRRPFFGDGVGENRSSKGKSQVVYEKLRDI